MSTKLVRLGNIKRALSFPLNELKNEGHDYLISGRVKSLRVMKSMNFIDLIDGSSNDHLQVIVKRELLRKADIGSHLTLQGSLIESHWPQQNVEFRVNNVIRVGDCDSEQYPLLINHDETKDGWYRKYFHLRPRAPHFASLLRVRSELELSLHMILRQMDFFKVQTPTLTSSDCEAGNDLFVIGRRANLKRDKKKPVEALSDDEVCDDEDRGNLEMHAETRDGKSSIFDKDVFLTTSAQLHLECLAASLSKVYSLGSIFRAENSHGPRHLCEFTMFEAEEANVDHVCQLMDRVETVVKFVAQYISEVSEHKSDFSNLLDRYSHHENFKRLAHSDYVRMSYSDAVSILSRQSAITNMKFGGDINRTHEKALLKHCNNVPVFITDYPQELKPFYMKKSSDQKTVACFDLIAPLGGELCGGSLREDDLEVLRSNISRKHQHEQDCEHSEDMNWYLQLREYGSFPHGGFGLGLERLLTSLVGIKNIRDTVAFPRWPSKCPM